jgi:hypothetical protein
MVNREQLSGLTIAALGFAPGTKEESDYVRRTEYRAEGFEGIDAASWNGLRREKSRVAAGMRAFISAVGQRLLACTRTGKAINLVRTTVKSFAALSVRDRSSGNSPTTIPHNSRKATAITRILPIRVRLGAILNPTTLYTFAETIVTA